MRILIFCLLTICTIHNSHSQTNLSYSVNAILSSMPTGLRLSDGTIVYAKKITTGSSAVYGSGHGNSGPTLLGGTLDNSPPGPVSSSTCNTLTAYTGSKNPTLFTRISEDAPGTSIDNGQATAGASAYCSNSIGFHVWFSKPTRNIDFLLIDIDGIENGSANNNAEWLCTFAFNSTTYVNTTPTLGAEVTSTNLNISGTHPWRTMITSEINATVASNFPSTFAIQRRNAAVDNLDPDNTNGQVFYDINSAITDYFILYGLYRNFTGSSGHNSGMSPVNLTIYPDFGDAPNSYKTLLSSGGPSHGQQDYLGNNLLRLGSAENTESEGSPSSMANAHADDDGISTINPIIISGSSSQTIASYSITVAYNNNTGLQANYVAWIDWDNNGTFETSESVSSSTGAGSTSGNITLTWNNVTLSGIGSNTATYLRIRVTTEAITNSNIGGSFLDGEVEDYSVPFSNVLSQNKVNFNAKLINKIANVRWNIVNENNYTEYIIELSEDGIHYIQMKKIQAAGIKNYTCNFVIEKETCFLRLKIVQKDNQYVYSNAIPLNLGSSKIINLFPNPSNGSVYLNELDNEVVKITLINSMGMEIKVWEKFEIQRQLNLPKNLISGNYFIIINRKNGENSVKKIICP